jgi:hypothetical protein
MRGSSTHRTGLGGRAMKHELDKLNKLSESQGALRPGKETVSGVIALALAMLCFLRVLACWRRTCWCKGCSAGPRRTAFVASCRT